MYYKTFCEKAQCESLNQRFSLWTKETVLQIFLVFLFNALVIISGAVRDGNSFAEFFRNCFYEGDFWIVKCGKIKTEMENRKQKAV
jgi:hypothetical protein